jgi:serine/threonine protein phosphatase 1
MFLRRQRDIASPSTPRGHRAYAVGDVHGRLDLLNELLDAIERDLAARPPRKTLLIFLGDLIDRGPDSKAVVERLRTYRNPLVKTYFLAGNHEEVLLRLLAGERGILASWLKYGGSEFLASYGIDPRSLAARSERSALAEFQEAVPSEHARFIGSFADTLSFGDYLFVHAGIRPGLDLSLQSQTDLRWIRSPFLEDESDHGRIVVHGHSISDGVEWRSNRIGIDTGAYRTGVLTALALEGEQRWILDTVQREVGTEALTR